MALWGRSAPIRVMSLALLVGCASQQKKDARVVRDVHITGNDELSSRDIKKKILTEETGWWPFATKQYFDPVTWQSDLKRIERLYAAKGFYQAEIVKDQVVPDPPDGVQLEVQVREGKPTHVGKMEVEGLARCRRDRADVIKGLPLAPGAVFREEDWEADEAPAHRSAAQPRLREGVRRRARARRRQDPARGPDVDRHVGAQLLLRRDRGRQRAGCTRAGDVVTEQVRLAVKEGHTFSDVVLNEAQRRLFGLGVFATIRVTAGEPDETTARIPVRVDRAGRAVPHPPAGRGARADAIRNEFRGYRRVDEPRLSRRAAAADHPRRGRVGVSPERPRRREG